MEIQLTRGKVAIIDDADWPLVSRYKWHARLDHNLLWYAKTGIRREGRNGSIALHRLILGVTDPSVLVDHKDGNGLNNRRNNLRLSSPSGNSHNRHRRNGFKGVRLRKDCNRWEAAICLDYKQKYLGLFKTQEEAVAAYDKACLEYHGDFACPNNALGGLA